MTPKGFLTLPLFVQVLKDFKKLITNLVFFLRYAREFSPGFSRRFIENKTQLLKWIFVVTFNPHELTKTVLQTFYKILKSCVRSS